MNQKYKLINFANHINCISYSKDDGCPFEIKRMFYIYDMDKHCPLFTYANKKAKTLIVTLNGTCILKVNDGHNSINIQLNSHQIGLYIDKMVWHEIIELSEGAKLLVLSSEFYDKNDYINSYEMYIKELKNDC